MENSLEKRSVSKAEQRDRLIIKSTVMFTSLRNEPTKITENAANKHNVMCINKQVYNLEMIQRTKRGQEILMIRLYHSTRH